MIRAFDTIVARSVLVSLVGITLVHMLSLWTYEHALDRELTIAHEVRLAERLIAIKHSVMLVPADRREKVAHEVSGGPIEAHWSATRARLRAAPVSSSGRDWQRRSRVDAGACSRPTS